MYYCVECENRIVGLENGVCPICKTDNYIEIILTNDEKRKVLRDLRSRWAFAVTEDEADQILKQIEELMAKE